MLVHWVPEHFIVKLTPDANISSYSSAEVKLLSPEEARKTGVPSQHLSKTPPAQKTTARSSSKDHNPPLFAQLPRVDAIEEKYSIPTATLVRETTSGGLPVSGKEQNFLLETTARGREKEPLKELLVPPLNRDSPVVDTGSCNASDTNPPLCEISLPPAPSLPPEPVLPPEPMLPPEPSLPPELTLPPEPSLPPQLTLPPEVPLLAPIPSLLAPQVFMPPKVSQVSKLLSAISTWVSIPPDISWREVQDTRTESDMTQGSCNTRNPHGDSSPDGSCDRGEAGTMSRDREGSTRSHEGGDHTSREADHESRYGGKVGTVSPNTQQTADVSHDKAGAESAVFLPPVDCVSVSRIQRSLFDKQLRRHLQSVCCTLDLSFHQVLPQVSKTTSQFRYVRTAPEQNYEAHIETVFCPFCLRLYYFSGVPL